jgi:signal recognition particle receptor subunit beta
MRCLLPWPRVGRGPVPIINRAAREIRCKIVYFGPPGSGKTRNLQYMFAELPADRRGAEAAVQSTPERPLFFEYLPLNLGAIAGFTTRLHLYAAPGAAFFAATRQHVLQATDGLVFVADSQRRLLDENVESLQVLHADLAEQDVDPRSVPFVFQYNKRDLPAGELLSVEELDDALNFRGVPAFPAAAADGTGVFQTLRGIAEIVLRRSTRGS